MDPWRDDCYHVNGISFKIFGASSSQCVVNDTTSHVNYLVWKNIIDVDLKKECLTWVTSLTVAVEKNGRGNHSIEESAGYLSYVCLAPKRSILKWVLIDCYSGEWIFRYKVDLRDTPSLFYFHLMDADLIFVSFCRPLFLANLKTLELR